MNTNIRPNERLPRLWEVVIALFRSKFNVTIGSIGLLASITLGKVVWGIIITVIGFHLFFFANIALALYLGYVLGSMFYGFGILALGYLVLLIIFLLLRGVIQGSVKNKVARSATNSLDRMNAQMDQVPVLRIAPEYRDATLTTRTRPLESLERSVFESNRRAAQAQVEVMKHVDYLRLNYKSVAADMANRMFSDKVPAYKFIQGLFGKNSSKHQTINRGYRPSSSSILTAPAGSLLGTLLDKGSTLLPYSGIILKIARPVLTALVLSKSRNLLARLFGMKTKF